MKIPNILRQLSSAIAIFTSVVAAQAAPETTTYTYDELGRMVASSNSGGPRDNKQTSLSYDPAGNRTGFASGVPLLPPANAATFSISGPTAPLAEGVPAQFVITKSNPTSGPLTVVITTANGTATAPADYVASSAVLTFRNWETVQYFYVTTLADTVAEAIETFTATLSAPSPGAAIGTASATASMTGGEGPNQPPVAVADAQLDVVCGNFGARQVIANDTDPDGHYPITLVGITGAGSGINYVAADPSSGSITFTAPYIRNATYSVTYTIRDARGLQSVGTLAVRAVGTTAQCSGGYYSAQPPVGEGGE